MSWLFLAYLGPAIAGEPVEELIELGGDRPDFTESALVVPPGAIQLEGGMTWEDTDSTTTKAQAGSNAAPDFFVGAGFVWRPVGP